MDMTDPIGKNQFISEINPGTGIAGNDIRDVAVVNTACIPEKKRFIILSMA